MNVPDIIAVSSLVGGGLGFFLNYLINARKDNRSDYESLVNLYRNKASENDAHITVLENKLEEFQRTINNLQQELLLLKAKEESLTLLEPAYYTLPFAFWIKDAGGRVIYVNQRYEAEFLVPIGKKFHEYQFRTDQEFWGELRGREYSNNDAVAKQVGMYITQETVGPPDSDNRVITVIKYPIYMGSILIGVGGIAINSVNVKIQVYDS